MVLRSTSIKEKFAQTTELLQYIALATKQSRFPRVEPIKKPLQSTETRSERESQFRASVWLRNGCCTLLDPLQRSDCLYNYIACNVFFFNFFSFLILVYITYSFLCSSSFSSKKLGGMQQVTAGRRV